MNGWLYLIVIFSGLIMLIVCASGAIVLVGFARQGWKQVRGAWHRHWEARAAGHLIDEVRKGRGGI
jgi:hypothetical protein